jgi:hypothetical protein
MQTTQWSASDASKAANVGELEFQDNTGEWQHFHVLALPDRLLFGGCCNAGFLESGFILREDFESLDETLQEMLSDLETYYNDGPRYVSRIVCNERM